MVSRNIIGNQLHYQHQSRFHSSFLERMGELDTKNMSSNNDYYYQYQYPHQDQVLEVAPHPDYYHQMAASAITQFPLLTPDEPLQNGGSMTPNLPSIVSAAEFGDDPKFRLPVWGICVMSIGYVCVFVFGVIGNCSVLIVVARLHRMKTVTNLFICNLAIADLLVLLFCLLPNLISNIFIRKLKIIT